MISASLKGRHFLRVNDWSPEELTRMRELADELDERILIAEIDRLMNMLLSEPR